MAAQYHPDKVQHLGEDFQRLAHEKFVAIQKAYEKIKG
jgi:DnaJ like chaperone protein